MRGEYSELPFLQQLAGNTAMYWLLLAVILLLSDSGRAIRKPGTTARGILVIPMWPLCSLIGVFTDNMDINTFTQISFVVFVGLA